MQRVTKMKALPTLLLILLLNIAAAGSAGADIYVWTDENGVKHITNYAPPEQAEVLMRTPEIPYDAEADRQRLEADRRERLAREKMELAEREAQLELLEREANARVAAAEQLDRETRAYQMGLEAQAAAQENSSRSFWQGGSLWYDGRWPYPGYFPKGYYRKDGNIYYKKRYPHHREKLHKGSGKVGAYSPKRRHQQSVTGRTPHPSGRTFSREPNAYHRRN